MKDYREFKQSRLKTDPTSKDFTESQWERAYDAYKSSRRKLRGSGDSKRSSGRSSSRDSSKSRDRERSRSSASSGGSDSSSARKISRGSEKKRVKRSRSSAPIPAGEELSFKLSTSRLGLRQVRSDSAYNELRVLIRLMAWVAIVLIALSVAVKALYYTDSSAVLVALLEGLLKVVGVFVLRPFLEAMLDIPDIAMKQQKSNAPAPVALPDEFEREGEEDLEAE